MFDLDGNGEIQMKEFISSLDRLEWLVYILYTFTIKLICNGSKSLLKHAKIILIKIFGRVSLKGKYSNKN